MQHIYMHICIDVCVGCVGSCRVRVGYVQGAWCMGMFTCAHRVHIHAHTMHECMCVHASM